MARRRKDLPAVETATEPQEPLENLDSEASDGPGRGRTRSLGIPLTDDGNINWEHPKTRERVAQVLSEPGVQEKAGVAPAPSFEPKDAAPLVGALGAIQAGLARVLLKCDSEVAKCFDFDRQEVAALSDPGAKLLTKYGSGLARWKPEMEFLMLYSALLAVKLQRARELAEQKANTPQGKPNGKPVEAVQ
jgi:hypothetical protein